MEFLMSLSNSTIPGGRPGPFGPARVLLPQGRRLQYIHENEPTSLALDLLLDDGHDDEPSVAEDGQGYLPGGVKLPPEAQRIVLVTNNYNHVIGVLTWKSFGKRMSEIHSLKLDLSTLAVKDTDPESPRFIAPETYIDTGVNWREFDHVLVGTPAKVLGVLTVTDVLSRLNDFAEAFVLLFEIEHEIRDLILDVYSNEELQEVFAEMTDSAGSPEETARKGLGSLIEGESPPIDDTSQVKKIRLAMNLLQKAGRSRPIEDLKDFTFAQYREVIFSKANWPRFEPVFAASRDLLSMDFEKINELRNIVFHFRRGITPRDTDRLRRFREKLRYNRDLFNSQKTRAGGA